MSTSSVPMISTMRSSSRFDIGGWPGGTAGGKTPQHPIFPQSPGLLGNFLGTELAANDEHLDQPFGAAGVCGCAGRVGMMATNEAIMRASSGLFLARTPVALANCRSLNGLTWRTGKSGREQGPHDAT